MCFNAELIVFHIHKRGDKEIKMYNRNSNPTEQHRLSVFPLSLPSLDNKQKTTQPGIMSKTFFGLRTGKKLISQSTQHKPMTLHQAIEAYINSHKGELAHNTILAYSRNLRKFCQWIGEDTPLIDIDAHQVKLYQSSLLEHYAVKSRQNISNTLKTFFRYWKAFDKTNVSPDLIKSPRTEEKLPDYITQEQFEEIDESFSDEDYHQLTRKLAFHLLWNCGMRVGELVNINLEDINMEERFCYIRTEKSKRMRVVSWNEECHELLIKYLGVRLCMSNHPALFQTPQNTINPNKKRLSTRSVQRWCKELEQQLGFRVHPHAFRHGVCRRVIQQGGTRANVQNIAGHVSITSSEVYVRLNAKEQVKMQAQFLPGGRGKRKQIETNQRMKNDENTCITANTMLALA